MAKLFIKNLGGNRDGFQRILDRIENGEKATQNGEDAGLAQISGSEFERCRNCFICFDCFDFGALPVEAIEGNGLFDTRRGCRKFVLRGGEIKYFLGLPVRERSVSFNCFDARGYRILINL